MSSIQFQTNTTAELAAIRMENAELKIMIKTLLAEPPAAVVTKKTKKTNKTKTVPATEADVEASASGEPKEKRPASAWILFSSKQVQPLIRAAEEGVDKSEKTKVGTLNQFAGQLWSQKKEWSDEEITSAWAEFTPPEVSKQTLEGKSKRSGSGSGSSTGSAEKADPVADDTDAGKKARKPMSDEAKKAAAEKRALTKAAKAATATATATPVVPEQVADASEVMVAAKPKNTKIAPKSAKKVVDLKLDLWTNGETEYLKNARGDVLTVDGEWVGLWNGKSIDETAVEPSDFEQLETRD